MLADILTPHWLYLLIHHGRWASPAMVREMFDQAGLEVQAQQRAMGRHLLLTVGLMI